MQFVQMYHPFIPSTADDPVWVSVNAVDDHEAKGWVLVDPDIEIPPPVTPYYPKATADARFVQDAQLATKMAAHVGDGSTFDLAQRAALESVVAEQSTVVSAAEQAVTLAGDTPLGRLKLRDRLLKLARVEKAAVAAQTTTVLADLTGHGTISRIFMALGGSTVAFGVDSRLRIYTDGAATPDVDIDLGTLFCIHHATALYPGQPDRLRWGCDFLQTEIGGGVTALGLNLAVDMPFRDGIRVELANVTSATGTLYSQVFYDQNTPAPVVLRSAGTGYNAPAVVPSDQAHTLIDLADGDGWLLWHAICGMGYGGNSWLERNVSVYVGGELTPSMVSTGLEDWFGGSWYYGGVPAQSNPTYVVGVNDLVGYHTSQGLDLRKAHGGVRFEGGVRVVLETEPAVVHWHEMAHVFLYYLEV